MTTKEFIKMLKEVDPEGSAHIRTVGIPIYVEKLPGNYDGEFAFIRDGKYVHCGKGEKIHIITKTIEDFVFDNTTNTTKWSDIENLFVNELNAYCIKEQADERFNSYLSIAKVQFRNIISNIKENDNK